MSDERDVKDELGLTSLDELLAKESPEFRAGVHERARKLLLAQSRNNLGIRSKTQLTPELIHGRLQRRITSLQVSAELLYEQCELEARVFFETFGQFEVPEELTEEIVHKMIERCHSICTGQTSRSQVSDNGNVLMACVIRKVSRRT